MALEAFKQDYGDYPPSNWQDGAGSTFVYCGAQKLTEALLGWVLMGFHPKTIWSRNGRDTLNNPIYASTDPNLRERKGPYLEVAKTSVFRLGTTAANTNDGLYNYNFAPFFNAFDRNLPNYVICDVFGVRKVSITKPGGEIVSTMVGTPILYYRANTNNKFLSCVTTQVANSIYDYTDNLALLRLGILPNPDPVNRPHRLVAPPPPVGRYFCDPAYKVVDQKVPQFPTGEYWPNRPDTYILISAGADHDFGTSDDILNF
jgi:hypothetical protein